MSTGNTIYGVREKPGSLDNLSRLTVTAADGGRLVIETMDKWNESEVKLTRQQVAELTRALMAYAGDSLDG